MDHNRNSRGYHQTWARHLNGSEPAEEDRTNATMRRRVVLYYAGRFGQTRTLEPGDRVELLELDDPIARIRLHGIEGPATLEADALEIDRSPSDIGSSFTDVTDERHDEST